MFEVDVYSEGALNSSLSLLLDNPVYITYVIKFSLTGVVLSQYIILFSVLQISR